MPRQPLKTGTTNSIAEKMAVLIPQEAPQEIFKEVEKGVEKEKTSPSAAERIRIMQQHHLRKDMVTIPAEVEFGESIEFGKILNAYKIEDRYKERKDRVNWSQKTLAAHYLLEGIKRDKKKFDIE